MDASEAVSAAREAAESWLEHVDVGDMARSWQEAASGFRRAIDAAGWADSLGKVQASVGRPLERIFKSGDYRTELPGAPDGHYVLLVYETTFEHKARGQETVVPQLDEDGVWRVSGYWVK